MMKYNEGTVVTAFTAPVSSVFVEGQSAYLKRRGYSPVLLSSYGDRVAEMARDEGAEYYAVEMERDPKPIADLVALFRVVRLLLSLRPEIVNAGTPKAGLLCSLGALLARVPVRIYTLHGFRHESMSGAGQRLMIWIERFICRIVHEVVCVSPSVLSLGRELAIIPEGKGRVLASGSCGVDLAPFTQHREGPADRPSERERLGIPAHATVVGFVGRLIPRKGVSELISAWARLRDKYDDLYLLILGPYEDSQPLPAATVETIERDDRIVSLGYNPNVAEHMALMDIFTLPAHWEGFGNVLVEAAATGLPVVSTTGTGTRDAVSEGHNGLLVPPRDETSLYEALDRYVSDPQLRREHGDNGKKWAPRFDRERVWEATADLYDDMTGSGLVPAPAAPCG
mgnify:CR=1 FL=1